MFLYTNKEEYINLLFSYVDKANNEDYLFSSELSTKENLDRIFSSMTLTKDLAILLLIQQVLQHTPLDQVNILNEMLECEQINEDEFYDSLLSNLKVLQVFLQLR